MNQKQKLNICPVCGYTKLEEPPYNQYGEPTHEICSCCGYEYGFDDTSEGYTFTEYRKEWIKRGFPFSYKEDKPKNWNKKKMKKQLKNIKLVDYKPRI